MHGTNMNKDMMGFLSGLCFLKHHCFLSAFKTSIDLTSSEATCGCEHSSSPFYSLKDIGHLPWTHFESPWTPMGAGSSRILCPWGIYEHYMQMGLQEMAENTRTVHFFSAHKLHCPTKHKFQDKIMQNFKMVQWKIKHTQDYRVYRLFTLVMV